MSETATVGSPFSIVSGRHYNLGSNRSQTISVVFSPNAVGSYKQNVTLMNWRRKKANVAVSGTATNAPVPVAPGDLRIVSSSL